MAADADSTGSSPPDDRAVIELLVAAAIELLERGEADPLPGVCSDRPDLLPRVRRRLEQLAERGLIPVRPATLPRQVGPYRVVRELGRGGMGAVYLAEQQQPVRRLVAVKVIKLGMDSHEVVARFEAERQALARMNHPHIAQVFDAGVTPEGRPFFVMEYVEGAVLTAYCREHGLSVEARVRLLAAVARALQHAHDRGFVHRDLKPTNVLVAEHDGIATPKIIDFGVAKAALAGDAGHGAMHTRTDQVLGTPEYMSPEQAASGGRDVDARTDVYALGVVLYELLCGELPFDPARLRRATRGEFERILLDELPAAPSRRLVAGGGQGTTLRHRLAGELDWIALKALAKERERRYATALAFAEDLERWLRDEPVLAGPPTPGYRLRKYVHRNRTAVLSIAAAALISGGAWLVLGARSADAEAARARVQVAAEQHYREANFAVERLLARANDERMRRTAQNDAMRQELVAEALRFYEHWLRDRPSDPRLREGRTDALTSLSQVQWQMGQLAAAEATAREAVAEARALYDATPDARLARARLGEALRRLGRASWFSRRDPSAQEAFREAVALLELCCAEAPAQHSLSLSSALRELATALDGDASSGASLDAMQRSVAVLERRLAAAPGDAAAAHDLAIARMSLVPQLEQAGRLDEVEALLRRTEQDLPLLEREAARIEVMLHLARARLSLRQDDRSAAVVHRKAAAAAAERWVRDEPGRLVPMEMQLTTLRELAAAHERAGEFAAAAGVLQRAIAAAEAMVSRFPEDWTRRRTLATTLAEAAQTLLDRMRRGDLDRARSWAQRAVELRDGMQQVDGATPAGWWFAALLGRIVDADDGQGDAIWDRVAQELPAEPRASPAIGHEIDAWIGIAANRLRAQRLDAADVALQRATRLEQLASARRGQQASRLARLRGELALRRADAAAAVEAAEQVLAVRPTWWGRSCAADLLHGASQVAPGDAAAAVAWRDRAAGLYRSVIDELAADVARDPADPWQSVPWGFAGLQLARIEAGRGDPAAARACLDAALPVLERVQPEAHHDVWQAETFAAGRALRAQLAPGR